MGLKYRLNTIRARRRVPIFKRILELAKNQSWLRDEIFSGSRIPIPGIWDRDFLFWARSKNPENPEIPGIGIGI